MSDYQEGQTASAKDGRQVVFKGGEWHLMPGTASKPQPKQLSKTDQETLGKYRDSADAAGSLERAEGEFAGRMHRFQTGPGKDTSFGMMYPDTSGYLGGVKALGAAALRGTIGWTYSNRDHDDYQFMASRQAALNNAALSLQKGVQTKSDEVRIGRQNIDTARTTRSNRDIMKSDALTVALAKARSRSAAEWASKIGSLSGSTNPRGQSYEQWWQEAGQHIVRAQFQPKGATKPTPKTPAAPAGWSGFQEVK